AWDGGAAPAAAPTPAVLVAAAPLPAPAPPPASFSARHARRGAACHGPANPGGFFKLVGHRNISAKRVGCSTAARVVRRFPRYCTAAYAAQGECKVRRAGRWHCRSTIVGSLSRGAPSRERWRRVGRRYGSLAPYAPPPRFFSPQVTASAAKVVAPSPGNPYDETNHCIRTNLGGNLIPPADPAFQIRVLPGVPIAVGQG